MSKTTQSVTSQYLLEGAIYALEQCGYLLRHAVILYKNDGYSSAVMLTAFAREELGRSRILQELRKQLKNGRSVTLDDIKKQCEDHVRKQEYAQLSTVQRGSGDEGLAKLLKTRLLSHPQSQKYKESDQQLNAISTKQRKRTPDDRHKLRESALYVQPNESGFGWNRPQDISPNIARVFIEDAVNDYAIEYDRIQGGSIRDIDPYLDRALQEWHDRPMLPLPQWP